jgi:hypothetical protein
MRQFSVLALCLMSIIATATMGVPLAAQKSPEPVSSSPIQVSISMKQSLVPVGKPIVLDIAVKNVSNESYYGDDFLPHVEGEKGELARTEYHRRRRHEPGMPELAGMGPTPDREIKAGKTGYRGLPLGAYYDLSAPGTYSVYVEYQCENGKWQRTNTVQFIVQAPAR